MGRPWWSRKPPEDVDQLCIVGEPGEGKVLVTTRYDVFGDPIEQMWVSPEHAHNVTGNHWRRVQ